MTTNIYDIANQLERAIRNLPEYKAVEAVKVSVEANAEAKSTLDAYISFQKGIQEKLQVKAKENTSVLYLLFTTNTRKRHRDAKTLYTKRQTFDN
jgi:cell fate (sporulation/competence/biofilm development) regulator YlbF (YheA/YmcA/DUF963 family)